MNFRILQNPCPNLNSSSPYFLDFLSKICVCFSFYLSNLSEVISSTGFLNDTFKSDRISLPTLGTEHLSSLTDFLCARKRNKIMGCLCGIRKARQAFPRPGFVVVIESIKL
jgi:hypothetical protein